jgi:hypothetical protein
MANNNHMKVEDVELLPPSRPLLEVDRGSNKPPLAGKYIVCFLLTSE